MIDTKQNAAIGGEAESFDAFLREAASDSGSRPALRAGAKLASGRFQILGHLGAGAMGVVYEAFDHERKGKVALKTLTHVDPAGIYRLKNEFRALADVSHPSLVRLYELFADNQIWFFTMELVHGERFDAWIERLERETRPGMLSQLRDALAQLVGGVSAIHRAGKLHRDLKPSNVMVDRDGRVVVLDFGLVSAPELGGIGQTVADLSVSGTPAYMAPEQAAGREATAASDWYAVGVLLFEALTGSLPFRGRVREMLALKQLASAPSVLEFSPDAPEDLSTLCGELLALDPGARPTGQQLLARVGGQLRPSLRGTLLPEPKIALVGRERELAALRAAYRASVEGPKPVVVMLRGESGIGKSALMASFLDALGATTPAVMLRGRCYERETVPFKAFDAIVDELSRHLRRLPREEAAVLTPREAWALTRLFPVLGRLPAFASAPARSGADPHEIRRRGFVALGELLGSLCDRAPLVLHIDDLQWTDADSVALLFHLLRQAGAPQLLFVGSQRDGDYAQLEPIYATLPCDIRLDFRQLDISPLPPEHAVVLVGQELPARVVEEARGNPFLLGEFARHARQCGADDLATGSLSELLLARCETLPDEARALLRGIALSGGSVPLEVVLAAANAERSAFDALRDNQFVRRGVRRGEVECYHDKIREALVAALSEGEARSLHAELARAWGGSADVDPERLALHLQGAGELQRAAEYSAEAARRAADAFGFERAARLYALALELGTFDARLTHDYQLARADALAQAGRGVAAAEACVEAMTGAPPGEAAELARRAGVFYLQSGWLDAAVPLVNRGLAPFGLKLAPTNLGAFLQLLWQRFLLLLRGYALSGKTRDERAIERYAAGAPVSHALVCLEPLRAVTLETHLTRIALASGDLALQARGLSAEVLSLMSFDTAKAKVREFAARAEAICEQSGDANALVQLNHTVGFFELTRDPGVALQRFARARDLLVTHPGPTVSHRMPWITWNLLHARCLQGAFAEVARQIPALLDDAWAREHRGVTPFLAGVPGAVARVAVEDLEALRHDLERARRAAVTETFTWQDVIVVQGELVSLLYDGKAREALKITADLDSKMQKSPARWSRIVKADVRYLGAWARVACAEGLEPGSSERTQLLDQAERLLRLAGTAPDYSGIWQPPLQAGIHALRGHTELAIASLEARLREATPVDRFPAYTVFVRRHLGQLLGGDEGAALVAEADRFLTDQGSVNPARFVASLAPGLHR